MGTKLCAVNHATLLCRSQIRTSYDANILLDRHSLISPKHKRNILTKIEDDK